MRFKTAKNSRVCRDTVGAVCSLCAQDVYFGERIWYCSGRVVCRDCFTQFAEDALRPFETILGEEMGE